MMRVAHAMRVIPLIAVVALAVLLFGMVASATRQAAAHSDPQKRVLVNRVLEERQTVDDLDQAVKRLRKQVNVSQDEFAKQSSQARSAITAQRSASLGAGSVEMKGDGLVVKVSDSSNVVTSDDASFGVNRIQDNDLQQVVNALWAARAEAISINENRVSSMTPIRAAGGTIVVNYRPVSSPYRIVAIGADRDAFARSDVAQRFSQWKTKYGLGYSVEQAKRLVAPAYSGRGQVTFAKVE